MKILNLACGNQTSSDGRVDNIDWSPYVRLHQSKILRFVGAALLDAERQRKLAALPDNVVCHDLKHGLPYGDNSVDMVFHSHFLEHMDNDFATILLGEIYRVLKPDGLHRIAVPDLEKAVRDYQTSIQRCDRDAGQREHHDHYVWNILGWCVIREAVGTANQRPLRRWLENHLLGDARRRGQTHQWMYDRHNLHWLLQKCGFTDIQVTEASSSRNPQWRELRLELDSDGKEYRPSSLYMEARKP